MKFIALIIVLCATTIITQAQPRLAWYKFNETSGITAVNTLGSAGNATLVNGPVWSSGALSFDGVNDYVQTPVTNGSARTLAAWIYPRSSDNVGLIESVFDCDAPGDYGTGWGLNNGSISVILDDRFWEPGVAVTLNQWQHVCLAFDATQARLYLNGVLQSSLSYTQGAVNTAVTYKIGRSNANTLFFHGDIRDAKIYSRAVTDLEVLTIKSSEGPAPTTAPTGLTAFASTGSVSLSWQPANAGETWYAVSRSLTPGGPYTLLSGTVTGRSFVDTGVTNGTTYYYTVAAANVQGTGPATTEVSATPVPPTSYYVDPSGNDANAGTSTAAPWKSIAKVNGTTFMPGDQILFKRGGTWVGTLSPKGSGSIVAQITLGSYGTGAKPLIDGAGAGSVIALGGQSYWTIDGFEVISTASGGGGRSGIRISGGSDGSTIRRLRILNNDVHDILATPNVNDGARNWGGIMVWIDEPGRADEVLIQGNTVTNAYGQGISFWGEYENAGGGMNYNNCSPNVVVRGNKVWRTSGDGILVSGTVDELVEFNEVAYVGVLSGLGNAVAAAWPTRHRGGIWQYNHVHHTKWLEANDSTAFDNDGYVDGTTYFQYNYTHDNEGGFNMEYFWVWDAGKTVSRYNISVNDGRGTYARVYFSNRPGSELYNNVFYNPGMTLDVSNGGTDYHTFRNNIFVGAGTTASFIDQGVFYNNTFHGLTTVPDATNGNTSANPLFVSPNTTGDLSGFLLQASSTARNSGQVIANNGGLDFWGTALPTTAPHRGASQINLFGNYTATATFAHISGPTSVVVPFGSGSSANYSVTVRDQYFRTIAAPSVTWSLNPAIAGCSINSNGVVTLTAAAAGQRFAVTATSGAATHTFSFSASALVWTNSAGTGIWNTTDANWNGTTWTDGGDAVFAHTTTAQTVTLPGARIAAAVKIGNGSNNANYTFAGSSLAADTFTLQGETSTGPTVSEAVIAATNVSIAGRLGIGRGRLIVSGNSSLAADTIGSSGNGGLGDWGFLRIQDNAVVTATNGLTGDTTAWGLELNGGTLITKSLWAAPWYGSSRLAFNGTLIKANADNPNFIVTQVNGYNDPPTISAGGAKFDTDGHDIGIGVILQGVGGLTKSGAGMLTLSGKNTYSGATEIVVGTLEINQPSADNGGFTSIGSGPVNIRSGGTLLSSWNWTTGNEWNGGAVGRITIDQGGTWRITGIGCTVRNGLELRGGQIISNGQTNADWGVLHLKSEITATGGHSSTIAVDSSLSGSRSVAVDSGSRLVISGNIHNQISTTGSLTHTGSGTLVLSGTNTFTGAMTAAAGTVIIDGTLGSSATAAAGATLGGSGTITGSLSIASGASLAPGENGIGTLTAASTAINGTLAIQLANSLADRHNTTGNLDISNGTLALSGKPSAQDLVIASFGSLTGSAFAQVTGLPDGYQVTYDLTNKQIKLTAVSTGFAAWIGLYTLADPQPQGDPDLDGIPNLMEYVLGGDPSLASSEILPKADHTDENFVFTFHRRNSSAGDTTQIFQYGSNLTGWTNLPVIPGAFVSISNILTEPGMDEVVITIPVPGLPKIFGRLVVSRP